MKIVLYDTETTGLGNRDEVIQFSSLILNEKLEIVKFNNFYNMSTIKIDPKAAKVHNLSREFLLEKSGGNHFEYFFEKVKKDFIDDCVVFIAFNDTFDMRLINQTLANANMRFFDFGLRVNDLRNLGKGVYHLDLMRVMAEKFGRRNGRIKLEHVVNEIGEVDVKRKYDIFLKKVGISDANQYAHDARYDCFCMWCILNKYRDSVM